MSARPSTRFRFCLYVADRTQNSETARTNLSAICNTFLPDRYDIEVIDIFREPERALDDGILMTPTLVKLWPLPVRRIVGTLNEKDAVLLALGVGEAAA
jgi:circadian clock protein KaiB